ncbi:HTH domain-containing protein [Natrialbaceae archaeon GCM10025810]|uniref:HTH domain-containing protein n=1 Tax=Halovalidus salilacus TaxID=3075124 RepID=UPI0036228380
MPRIDLSSNQRATLSALINAYEETGSYVSAPQLAEELDRTTGTLRNQMSGLKMLGLVEATSGPRGGYKPTEAAYENLSRNRLDDAETVTLAHEFDRVDATVDEIDFTNVHHPDLCRAQIHFQQSIRDLSEGDAIAVGPSPISDLVVLGEVVAIDAPANVAIVDVGRIEAPVDAE